MDTALRYTIARLFLPLNQIGLAMHTVSGRSLLGLSLALFTSVMWGLLPIALKDVLVAMDAYTITFYRFFSAGLILLIWLAAKKALPVKRQFVGSSLGVLAIAALCLTLNYGSYIVGLELLEPKAAQVVIQLAPFLLLLGSVWLFKESFSRWQGVGAVALVIGLLLFFNQRVELLLTGLGQYTQGIIWIAFAAVVWAIYALLQKLLLKHFTSIQLLMMINLSGGALFWFLATPAQVFELTNWQLLMLLFCCLNTVFAYSAFAEALAHWEASKISAVLALTPLITIITLDFLAWRWPEFYESVHLNLLALLGAALVITGSMLAALGKRKLTEKQ